MSHSPHAVLATLLVALALTACGGGATATVPVQPPTSLAQTPTTPVPTPTTRSAELTTLNEGLRAAAWTNDVTEARRLITLGADVNAKDETQQSAYLIATSEGYLDLLRLTLAHGAKVDDKDSWNGTGLIRAAERGHALVVGELLRAGIARDHINRIGYQAIHEAVWLGDDTPEYATTVRVLAAGGVELDRRAPSAELTPLEMARQIGHTGAAGILETITSAARPADPDAALLQAAEVGDANAVAIALRAGANIEARDAHDRTALLLAATYDQIPVANVLVAMGANPNALDDRHDTPWLVTGVTGRVAMLEALLPANPDLTIRNRFGGLSPIPASERGHVDYVRRVVLTGVDLNHVNDLGWTALLEAVILGDGGPNHQEVVQILLAAGADRDIADRAGVSALQHAEQRGQNEVARLLRQR
ncbi:MAG TPA: ankyrin repeat domain-containing protein [Dermatophilaceae bacterium]|nr:ankyrin repeat domain-containing protein [Dermatophilaceae bacterium]